LGQIYHVKKPVRFNVMKIISYYLLSYKLWYTFAQKIHRYYIISIIISMKKLYEMTQDNKPKWQHKRKEFLEYLLHDDWRIIIWHAHLTLL